MMKAMFSSNLCQNLLIKLKENIFFNNPITKAYIFVPNRFVKQYLMKEFCDDRSISVSFNLNFINIKNFLNFFENQLEIPRDKRFFDYLKLHFLISQKIMSGILETNYKYLELKKYLIKDGRVLQKRLNSLVDELSTDFLRYSIFGNFLDLQKKMKSHWQANLFYDIFYNEGYPLCFRDLKHRNQTFENYSFHFFAIDYIPDIYFDFINRLSNIYHYFISPCKIFWEDIVSDFERQKIQKYYKRQNVSDNKIEELSCYLKDRNSYLANMEKVKKSYLKIMSNYDNFEIFENYSNVIDHNPSLLKQFQNDILNLESRENALVNIEKEESSIQVHISTSKFREVQILYSNILKLLSEDDDISLKDIKVFVPNIDEYVTFIHMVFSNQEEKINYKISNISLIDESYLLAGLKVFFSIAHNNWDKVDVITLFENPLFQKKHKLSKEEVYLLFDWIEKANISWGLDEDHVKKVMKDKNPLIESLYAKTFEGGFSRILFGLVFLFNSKYIDSSFNFDFWPDGLDLSKSNILDKVLKIFAHLETDLKIIEENRSLTLFEWAEFFMKIISDHFSLNFQKDDSENFSNFIEKSAFDACFEFLNSLKEIKISKKVKEDRYSFEVIFDLFEKHLKRTKTHFNPNDQMAINFTSFETSSLPAKAVFLIGLDENVLTIKDQNSLSLTANLNIPTDSEHIRSRFLQSLLSAKNNLYLSYTSKDGGLIDSSILLQEFITYLDDSYRILKNKPSDYIIKKNTPFSFHKNNFTKGSSSFAGQDFIAAKAYWNTNNRKEAKFKGDFKENRYLDDDIPEVIDLKSLKKLSKNPIRFYLNEGLDIYLESKIDISDFNVSFLDKYLIKRASSNDKIEDILFSYEKEAKMPLGFFGEIEKRAIIESHTQFHRDLKNLGIDKDKIISIDLSLSCQNIEKIDQNNIKMPAVEINIQDKKVKIIGRLDNISNKGLLVYSDDKVSSLVQIWAEILIFYKLKLKNIPKQILFMKNNKVKDLKIDDLEKNLSNYIQYYLNSKKSISYMIPSFSEHILKKNERSFQKAINNIKKNRILDVYFSWLSQNDKIIEPRKIIESQSDYMQSIFRTILEDF